MLKDRGSRYSARPARRNSATNEAVASAAGRGDPMFRESRVSRFLGVPCAVIHPSPPLLQSPLTIGRNATTNAKKIRGVEDKLSSDPYRNIEEKHRRKMIEHRTTEMAVSDLDKYWTALDKVRTCTVVVLAGDRRLGACC